MVRLVKNIYRIGGGEALAPRRKSRQNSRFSITMPCGWEKHMFLNFWIAMFTETKGQIDCFEIRMIHSRVLHQFIHHYAIMNSSSIGFLLTFLVINLQSLKSVITRIKKKKKSNFSVSYLPLTLGLERKIKLKEKIDFFPMPNVFLSSFLSVAFVFTIFT